MRIATPAEAQTVLKTLRADIASGQYAPGQKLPSEAQLIKTFGVKRHVVRKALDLLRKEGLIASYQGAGVFVCSVPDVAMAEGGHDPTVVLELSEFRLAVETEAAALAAIRRSPAQEEEIFHRHRMFGDLLEAKQPTLVADLALHKAIAQAANNRQFSDFVDSSGSMMVPQMALFPTEGAVAQDLERLAEIHQEHAKIVSAISASDAIQAGHAMRMHLENSLQRYRRMLTIGVK